MFQLEKTGNSVRRLFVYCFFSNLFLERSISVIFLLNRGLSSAFIMTFQMIINISMFVSEVPTGLISDAIGKKKGLIIGSLFSILYYVLLLNHISSFVYLLSAVCLGVGSTFISGTDKALLYDMLDSDGLQNNSLEYIGKMDAVITLSSLMAILCGGFVQKFSWLFLLILSIILQMIGLLALFFVKEDLTYSKEQARPFILLKELISYIRKSPFMKYFLILVGFQSGIISAVLHIAQELLSSMGMDTIHIAVFFFVNGLVIALISGKIKTISEKVGKKKIMQICLICSLFIFPVILISNPYSLMIALILLNSLLTIPTIILFDMFNRNLQDQNRATGISLYKMVSAVIVAFVFGMSGIIMSVCMPILCVLGFAVSLGLVLLAGTYSK